MKRPLSWRDWWASRTIRFNAYMGALWAALTTAFMSISEAQLEALGLTEHQIILAMGVIGILQNWRNNYLRKVTTLPLDGRSSYA